MANATKEAEDGSASQARAGPRGRLGARRAHLPRRPSWLSYARHLRLLRDARVWPRQRSCVRGPLHGAGPVRVLIPQPAMFAVRLRGVGRRALGAGLAAPPRQHDPRSCSRTCRCSSGWCSCRRALLVLACVGAACLRLLGPAQAGPLQGVLQRGRRAGSAWRSRLSSTARSWEHTAPSASGAGRPPSPPCGRFCVTMHVPWSCSGDLLGQTTERRTGPNSLPDAMLTAASVCLAIVVLDAAWMNLWATVPRPPGRRPRSSRPTGATPASRFASPRSSASTTSAVRWVPRNLEPIVHEPGGAESGVHRDAGPPGPAGPWPSRPASRAGSRWMTMGPQGSSRSASTRRRSSPRPSKPGSRPFTRPRPRSATGAATTRSPGDTSTPSWPRS